MGVPETLSMGARGAFFTGVGGESHPIPQLQ